MFWAKCLLSSFTPDFFSHPTPNPPGNTADCTLGLGPEPTSRFSHLHFCFPDLSYHHPDYYKSQTFRSSHSSAQDPALASMSPRVTTAILVSPTPANSPCCSWLHHLLAWPLFAPLQPQWPSSSSSYILGSPDLRTFALALPSAWGKGP